MFIRYFLYKKKILKIYIKDWYNAKKKINKLIEAIFESHHLKQCDLQ